MNFDVMPELHWPWGYAGFWVVILIVAGTMLAFFKKKQWL
jgi:magnesium transporter